MPVKVAKKKPPAGLDLEPQLREFDQKKSPPQAIASAASQLSAGSEVGVD